MSRLCAHVLDTTNGVPAAGVRVELSVRDDGVLGSVRTDQPLLVARTLPDRLAKRDECRDDREMQS